MRIGAIFLGASLVATVIGVEARGVKHGTRTRLRGAHQARRVAEAEVPHSTPTTYCNSIACPIKYVPVTDAHAVECVGGGCKVEQCCSLFCSSFGCGAGTNPIPYADKTLCENGVCTQERCCDGDQPHSDHGSCMSYVCPAGFAIKDNAADVECKHDPNEEMVSPEPAPGSEGDDGIYSYSYDDFFDEAFSYDFSGGYESEADDVAGSGDGRRMLRSVVGRGAESTNKFIGLWGTSSSSEQALCSVETCCREL